MKVSAELGTDGHGLQPLLHSTGTASKLDLIHPLLYMTLAASHTEAGAGQA